MLTLPNRLPVRAIGSTRLQAFALAGAAAVTAMGVTQSMALFTSQTTTPANAFSTGTVVINASPASALVTFSNMAPGDVVTNPLTISNSGTLALRYAVSTGTTNTDTKGLASQMQLVVKTQGTSCSAFDGTTIYTGSLASAAIGSNATGADTGDRSLNAASSEILCFRASLPLATGNAYQNATTTATFTFDAEQTVNN